MYSLRLPGRIVSMAEEEGESRRRNERSLISKSFSLDIIGTLAGLIAVAGVIWLCYMFVEHGYPTEGAYVACGVIVSLAIVFVLRRRPKTNFLLIPIVMYLT